MTYEIIITYRVLKIRYPSEDLNLMYFMVYRTLVFQAQETFDRTIAEVLSATIGSYFTN